MAFNDTDLSSLFLGARNASGQLRTWARKTHGLRDDQLDPAMIGTFAQIQKIAQDRTCYGYDVSTAPVLYFWPVDAYLKALEETAGAKTQQQLDLHRRIVLIAEESLPGRTRRSRRHV